MSKNTEYDFWSRVDIGTPDECWPWTGARFSNGYGAVKYRGKQWRTHRLAYTFCQGEIVESILHSCDNKPCCNPMHLWDDSQKVNQEDMTAKGRGRVGTKNGMYTHPHKLRLEDVRTIKKLQGAMTQEAIAHLFGVTQSLVSAIHRGARWKTVSLDTDRL